MHRFVYIILLCLTVLSAAGLALSCLSVYVSPERVWFLPFFGLLLTPLLLLNLAFLLLWIIFRKWLLLLPLAVILASLGFVRTLVNLPASKKSAPAQSKLTQLQLKLLSYNVNLFGLKNSYSDISTYAQVAGFINHEKFDVACMQEFYTHSEVQSEQQFARRLPGLPHYYVHYSTTRRNRRFGIATFSRFPVVNQGSITFPNTVNAAIFTDIALNASDTVRVYNVHLQSVRFGDRERDLLQDERFWYDNKKDHSRVLRSALDKLKNAFLIRAQQVDALSRHMRRSPYAVVVCGDFNDTPISYTYHTMRGNFCDGFIEAGRGLMSTFVSIIPSFRIDYILYSSHFCASACYCPNLTCSDHYPLVCRLAVRSKDEF
ncbi:MAG: endonuclease/exonuclease/phosphatase family protein [Prevotellaceae bacterium]|jgi:endonuclease/exonuclease/phosphatase family metal-dependent hydrolase|nr:endonuclease/exonuclease/phosphatase family protein [Prevotellaceae bacterium]